MTDTTPRFNLSSIMQDAWYIFSISYCDQWSGAFGCNQFNFIWRQS